MHDMEEIRHTQALQPGFSKLHQGLGPVTDQIEDLRSQGLEPLLDRCFPRGVGAIVGDHLQQQVPCAEVHTDEHHLFQERFIHRTNDLAPFLMRLPSLLPGHRRLQKGSLQRLHHPA
jgi:hypothetical protein